MTVYEYVCSGISNPAFSQLQLHSSVHTFLLTGCFIYSKRQSKDMPEYNTAISQRENYTPSTFTEFLWWLSTSERELLVDTVVDRNRFKIVGMTVLATWVFATLTWTYFFSTIISNAFLFILLGAFMGFVIMTIDRALIKGINKFNKRKVYFLSSFRECLPSRSALLWPSLLLYMFDKEIKLQTSLDNEKKKKQKKR